MVLGEAKPIFSLGSIFRLGIYFAWFNTSLSSIVRLVPFFARFNFSLGSYCKSLFFSEHLILAFSPLKKSARDNLERDNWHRAIIWCSLKFGARDNLGRATITDAQKFVSAEMRSENSRFSRKVRGFSGKFRGFRRKSGKHQILASAKF